MTLNELIARIRVVALETARAEIRPALLDTGVIAEVLLPAVSEFVSESLSRTPDGLVTLRDQITVTFVAGVGDVPEQLKTEYTDFITFKDDPAASYVPSWHEFQLDPEPGEVPMDYSRFHINNSQIFYHRYDQVKYGFSGDLVLIAVLQPQLPAAGGDTVAMNATLIQKIIVTTAAVINGQIPLTELGLDYGSLESVRKQAA